MMIALACPRVQATIWGPVSAPSGVGPTELQYHCPDSRWNYQLRVTASFGLNEATSGKSISINGEVVLTLQPSQLLMLDTTVPVTLAAENIIRIEEKGLLPAVKDTVGPSADSANLFLSILGPQEEFEIPGFGRIASIPNTFTVWFHGGFDVPSHMVNLRVTSDPWVRNAFAGPAPMFDNLEDAGFEYRVNVGTKLPTQGIDVYAPIPLSLQAAVDSGAALQFFAAYAESEGDDYFRNVTTIPTTLSTSGDSVEGMVAVQFFDSLLTDDSTYELVLILGIQRPDSSLKSGEVLPPMGTSSEVWPEVVCGGEWRFPLEGTSWWYLPNGKGEFCDLSPGQPCTRTRPRHYGTDIAVGSGTPVHPIKPGVVKVMNPSVNEKGIGYGKRIVIRHYDGSYSQYAHLRSYGQISEGQVVGPGQIIGYSGCSGTPQCGDLGCPPPPTECANHLHIEYNPNGAIQYGAGPGGRVDPRPCLDPHLELSGASVSEEVLYGCSELTLYAYVTGTGGPATLTFTVGLATISSVRISSPGSYQATTQLPNEEIPILPYRVMLTNDNGAQSTMSGAVQVRLNPLVGINTLASVGIAGSAFHVCDSFLIGAVVDPPSIECPGQSPLTLQYLVNGVVQSTRQITTSGLFYSSSRFQVPNESNQQLTISAKLIEPISGHVLDEAVSETVFEPYYDTIRGWNSGIWSIQMDYYESNLECQYVSSPWYRDLECSRHFEMQFKIEDWLPIPYGGELVYSTILSLNDIDQCSIECCGSDECTHSLFRTEQNPGCVQNRIAFSAFGGDGFGGSLMTFDYILGCAHTVCNDDGCGIQSPAVTGTEGFCPAFHAGMSLIQCPTTPSQQYTGSPTVPASCVVTSTTSYDSQDLPTTNISIQHNRTSYPEEVIGSTTATVVQVSRDCDSYIRDHTLVSELEDQVAPESSAQQAMDRSSIALSVYPNPSNGSFNLVVSLREESDITCEIVNVLGQVVDSWEANAQSAGEQTFTWESGNAASGLYLFRVRTDEQTAVAKLLLLK